MPSFLSSSQLQSHRSASSLPTTGILRSAGWDDSGDKLEEAKRRLLKKLRGQEYLLARVTAGRLSLPDGGAKLSAQVSTLQSQLAHVDTLLAALRRQQADGDEEEEADSASASVAVRGSGGGQGCAGRGETADGRAGRGGGRAGRGGGRAGRGGGRAGRGGGRAGRGGGRAGRGGGRAGRGGGRAGRGPRAGAAGDGDGDGDGGDRGGVRGTAAAAAAGDGGGEAAMGRVVEDGADSTSRVARQGDGKMDREGGMAGDGGMAGEGRMVQVVEGVGDSAGLLLTAAVAPTVTVAPLTGAAPAVTETTAAASAGAESQGAKRSTQQGAQAATQLGEGWTGQLYTYRDTGADSDRDRDSTGSLSTGPSVSASLGPSASVRTRTSSFQPSCSSAAMRRLWSLHRAVETTIDDPALDAAGVGRGFAGPNGSAVAAAAAAAGGEAAGGGSMQLISGRSGEISGGVGSAGSAGTRASLPPGSSAPRLGSDGRLYRLRNGRLERVGADKEISPEAVRAAREKVRRDMRWEAERAAARLGRVLKIDDSGGIDPSENGSAGEKEYSIESDKVMAQERGAGNDKALVQGGVKKESREEQEAGSVPQDEEVCGGGYAGEESSMGGRHGSCGGVRVMAAAARSAQLEAPQEVAVATAARCARVISVLEAAQLLAEQRTQLREYEEKILASSQGACDSRKPPTAKPPRHNGAMVREDSADEFENDDDALSCDDDDDI
ncbi:hypothetical protein CLOM_g17623 [Closterium sp. NIES-68]|nr:hypothetical protein CLOM_g17623 [Closterium sp. NIES-68]GJP67364.1 hypothetical protein CLOP_g24186 [Closterium sp. NIES-67]